MHKRMAVLAQTLEVVEGEGYAWVSDVVWREVRLVMHDLCRPQLAICIAALAHERRDDAVWRVKLHAHVGVAVVSPCGRMIKGDGPILCHDNLSFGCVG